MTTIKEKENNLKKNTRIICIMTHSIFFYFSIRYLLNTLFVSYKLSIEGNIENIVLYILPYLLVSGLRIINSTYYHLKLEPKNFNHYETITIMFIAFTLWFIIGKTGINFNKFNHSYYENTGLKLGIISAAVLHILSKTFEPHKENCRNLNSVFIFVNSCFVMMSIGVINIILKQYNVVYSLKINITIMIFLLLIHISYSLSYNYLFIKAKYLNIQCKN